MAYIFFKYLPALELILFLIFYFRKDLSDCGKEESIKVKNKVIM